MTNPSQNEDHWLLKWVLMAAEVESAFVGGLRILVVPLVAPAAQVQQVRGAPRAADTTADSVGSFGRRAGATRLADAPRARADESPRLGLTHASRGAHEARARGCFSRRLETRYAR